MLAVHTVESRLVPLPAVRRVLAGAGAVAVLLAWAFPGELRPATNAWARVHWALGVTDRSNLVADPGGYGKVWVRMVEL